MVASLQTLLDGVIDYAGLFPPAKLDMAPAVANYIRTLQGDDEWFLGRFVCASTQLNDLKAALLQIPDAPEIPVSVIGRANDNLDGWHSALEHDAKTMTDFVKSAGDLAVIEAYEVRIPSHKNIEACIRDLNSFQDVDVFVELPWGMGIDDSLAALAETEWLCAKARTGGPTPGAFPAAAELAEFLHGAVGLDLSFKLTAGLHHPFPKHDRETGARMHGFINVLAACAFALSEDMSRSELEDLLLTQSSDAWSFTDKQLRWCDSTVSIEDIEDSRELFWSIGSCSPKEGLDELGALGLTERDN